MNETRKPRTHLAVPVELHRKLKIKAVKEGVKLQEMVRSFLEAGLEKKGAKG